MNYEHDLTLNLCESGNLSGPQLLRAMAEALTLRHTMVTLRHTMVILMSFIISPTIDQVSIQLDSVFILVMT